MRPSTSWPRKATRCRTRSRPSNLEPRKLVRARLAARWRNHDGAMEPSSVTSTLSPPADRHWTQATGLHVVAWIEPKIDALGIDARSHYVETFWLPVLGPSATWLLRRIADGLDRSPDGFELDLEETARALRLGGRGGRHSPFRRAILRCTRYGLARHAGKGVLAVRRTVAPLPHRHL